MPRPPREFVPGVSVHLMQRGLNRMVVFHDPADHMTFLAKLRHALHQHDVALHAFAVMDNHFHLIATPGDRLAIPGLMKEVATTYTNYYNRRYARIGTAWNGRYKPKVIDDEIYWLTCLMYVEQNPVRAQITATPDEYRWSSYPFHAWGQGPDWLVPHPVYLGLGRTPDERQETYRRMCTAALGEDALALVRCDIPIGSTLRVPQPPVRPTAHLGIRQSSSRDADADAVVIRHLSSDCGKTQSDPLISAEPRQSDAASS
jgi:REP-associated tyrosine transposase